MGQLDIAVRVDSARVDTLLTQVAARATNLTPLWRQVDVDVTGWLGEQFDTQGRAFGTPWAALAPLTVQLRTRVVQVGRKKAQRFRLTSQRGRARAGFTTILRDTNTLWASLAKHTGPNHVKVLQPMYYARGTTVEYAQWQQTGWTSRSVFRVRRLAAKRIPARPIVPASGLPSGYLDRVSQRAIEYLNKSAP